jgi:hypothetical protein
MNQSRAQDQAMVEPEPGAVVGLERGEAEWVAKDGREGYRLAKKMGS